MRRLLFFCLILVTLSASAGGPFKKTYKNVSMSTVLHDIEAHFSLQIMYRPQDLAGIPPVTCNINTSDYQTALKQVLGKRLQYTVKKNIVIITPAPKTSPSQPKPQGQTQASTKPVVTQEQPKSRSVSTQILSDTLAQIQSQSTQATIQNSDSTSIQVVTDDTDSTNVETAITQDVAISNAVMNSEERVENKDNVENQDSIETVENVVKEEDRIEDKIENNPMPETKANTEEKTKFEFQYRRRHTFMPSFSIGYGSELMTQLDLRYVYYFHRNWGVGTGLNFAFAAQKAASTDSLSWRQEGRIGFPFAVAARYTLSKTWGILATVGATASFMAYSGKSGKGISGKTVDVFPFLEVDALHPISAHTELLFGLYTHISAISVSPWSVGLHLGIIIGK
jgi:hypothetical protein